MTIDPNAFLALDRERTHGFGVNARDLTDIVRDPGFLRSAAGNAGAAVHELRGVLSRASFVRAAARYVPAVAGAAVEPLAHGVRAQAMDRRGRLLDDFVIERRGALTLIRNAPSPPPTRSRRNTLRNTDIGGAAERPPGAPVESTRAALRS